MLSEQEVKRARYIHDALYRATRNPLYHAFVCAYDIVLADNLPEGMAIHDIDELIEEYEFTHAGLAETNSQQDREEMDG